MYSDLGVNCPFKLVVAKTILEAEMIPTPQILNCILTGPPQDGCNRVLNAAAVGACYYGNAFHISHASPGWVSDVMQASDKHIKFQRQHLWVYQEIYFVYEKNGLFYWFPYRAEWLHINYGYNWHDEPPLSDNLLM